MPCVFPVLFLKGLALLQSSGQERKHLRSHGLVYTLGILVSFWIIVGVLLALRAGGSQAGWGFQLQSPTFLTLLASGIFFFALSLAGLFDIGLSLTSVGGDLAQKQGYTGSFFTGVLATVVATPCTAPLMGAAIGFALAQPAAITFAVFTALALGLAAPYLLLSFQPAWTRILPRPGAWMEIFKQITAVIFFATVIWLVYVYGSLFAGSASGNQSIYRVALLLGCFLMLAVAGWVLGKWPARWTSTIAAILIAAVGLAIPLYQPKDTTLVWSPYSQQALDQARAAGHPVFIDFTAAWCLSCQVNERLVLKSADVQHQFSKNNVTLLSADWTQYDPEITKQLASVNRSGVPTYVIYPAARKLRPRRPARAPHQRHRPHRPPEGHKKMSQQTRQTNRRPASQQRQQPQNRRADPRRHRRLGRSLLRRRPHRQFHLMTDDVVFLTSGRAPMRRDEFAAAFRAMTRSPPSSAAPTSRRSPSAATSPSAGTSSKSPSPPSKAAQPASTQATS